MQSINSRLMMLDSVGEFMIGHYFKKLKLGKKSRKVHFFFSSSLGMPLIL